MLLGTLGVSLLGNMLEGKGIVWERYGNKMIALQKLWKMFLFNLKSPFGSQDIQIFVIFSLSKLSRFKRANGSGIIYDVMNWLASSNLVR